MMEWSNWSGSATCRPASVHYPERLEGVQRAVRSAGPADTVRVVGAGHSFPPVATSDDVLVSLERYTGLVDVDGDAGTATVRAGTSIHDLNRALAERGLALENMGDIDSQAIAGAICTGTHGTGDGYGVLADTVERLRLVTADGGVRELDPSDGDAFRCACVSLGTLGVITEVTLSVRAAYDLEEHSYTAPVDAVLADLDRHRRENDHFEFWWFPHTDTAWVKTLNEVDAAAADPTPAWEERLENVAWEGLCRLGTRLPGVATPYLNRATVATFDETRAVGPSHEVYPTTRDVRFNESEFGVPADDAVRAFEDLRRAVEGSHRVQFPVEFRTVAGDDLPLSPAYGRDSAFLACHRYHRKPYRAFLEHCARTLEPYDARPHWGKHHWYGPAEFARLYPEWDTFREVRRAFDPDGVFLNDHLARVFEGGGRDDASASVEVGAGND